MDEKLHSTYHNRRNYLCTFDLCQSMLGNGAGVSCSSHWRHTTDNTIDFIEQFAWVIVMITNNDYNDKDIDDDGHYVNDDGDQMIYIYIYISINEIKHTFIHLLRGISIQLQVIAWSCTLTWKVKDRSVFNSFASICSNVSFSNLAKDNDGVE